MTTLTSLQTRFASTATSRLFDVMSRFTARFVLADSTGSLSPHLMADIGEDDLRPTHQKSGSNRQAAHQKAFQAMLDRRI
jgi:hypothetical protein